MFGSSTGIGIDVLFDEVAFQTCFKTCFFFFFFGGGGGGGGGGGII